MTPRAGHQAFFHFNRTECANPLAECVVGAIVAVVAIRSNAMILFRTPAPRITWIGASAAFLGAAACGGTTDIITPPPPPPPPAGLTVTIVADVDDRATAEHLGWGAGIPGVDVSIAPSDSSAPARSFRTGPDGAFSVTDLAPRDYLIETSRWLTPSEKSLLVPGDDAVGFVGRAGLRIATDTRTATITTPASRQRAMVISEWALNPGATPGQGESYPYGGFLELHNNSDSTVYLDGMALGRAVSSDYDYPSFPCGQMAQWSDDPAGVWTLAYQVFPGAGRDHPVFPGGTVVIATDAIDHRSLYPGSVDLSGADFEFAGSNDVDNPSVPNLINTGYDADLGGHGVLAISNGDVVFLSRPFLASSVPLTRYPGTSQRLHPRIPRDHLLDVLAVRTNFDSGLPECPRLVHSNFDRDGFRGRGTNEAVEYQHSVERRAAPSQVSGRTLLQHTRDGAADFVRGSRTPGTVPE